MRGGRSAVKEVLQDFFDKLAAALPGGRAAALSASAVQRLLTIVSVFPKI